MTGKLVSRELEDKLRSLQGIREKLKDLCFEVISKHGSHTQTFTSRCLLQKY